MFLADDAQVEGLAVVTEAKYGFTGRDGVVGVSLVRSALVTEADLHPAIRDVPDRPRHSDLHVHQIELALGRYAADLPAADHPALLADTLFTPCLPYQGDAIASGLAALDCTPSLVPAWAKPVAAGTWVLRLQESCGRSGQAALQLAPGWTAAIVGLAEIPAADAAWQTGRLTVPAKPFEVVSVMIKAAQS
jgi:alpha-mannosidase